MEASFTFQNISHITDLPSIVFHPKNPLQFKDYVSLVQGSNTNACRGQAVNKMSEVGQV